MKRLLWAPVTLSLAFLVGCGGSEKPVANSNAPSSNSGSTSNGSKPGIVVPTDPKEIVRVFLDAMRAGNGEQLSALFSSNARIEIEKHGIKIEPPGSANAIFEIGDLKTHGDAILVESLWKEPPTAQGGETQEMEVVWVLRKESAGWRVCEMAVDPGTGEEVEVVNFERLEQPEETPAQPASRVASLPQAATGPAPASAFPQNGLPTNNLQATGLNQLPPANLSMPQAGLPPVGPPTSAAAFPPGTMASGLPAPAGLPSGLPQGGLPGTPNSNPGLPPTNQLR